MNSILNMLQVRFESPAVRELYSINVFNPFHSEDAGMDLHCPETIEVPAGARGFKIDLRIKCCMVMVDARGGEVLENKNRVPFLPGWPAPPPSGTPLGMAIPYQLWPRSSISKTPLRMSNSVGLIDKGYRGSIQLPVDNLSDSPFPYTVEAGVRLCQIVSFNGGHIFLTEVNSLPESVRGEGGFGSTGTH